MFLLKIRRVGDFLTRLALYLAALLLFALMLMTFSDVVLRSLFNAPLASAPELTRIFLAMIVFTALPVVSARGQHISVDLLDGLFKGKLAQIRAGLVNLACGIMLIWPGLQAWKLAKRSLDYGDVTEFLNIPTFYIGGFIAIFTLLTMTIFIIKALFILFTPLQIFKATEQ